MMPVASAAQEQEEEPEEAARRQRRHHAVRRRARERATTRGRDGPESVGPAPGGVAQANAVDVRHDALVSEAVAVEPDAGADARVGAFDAGESTPPEMPVQLGDLGSNADVPVAAGPTISPYSAAAFGAAGSITRRSPTQLRAA